ncbi:hypothetical protein DRO69_00840 [Candidatus Bathyarchaeota archaeon]|nr:MAG: hypothetical protein DRO69_00840 [Candidatus Bathyarchaeota archaeon]
MSEEEHEEKYDLAQSYRTIGALVPVIKDAYGNVIDGFHRLEVDSNWPSIKLEHIRSKVDLVIARLIVNVCRRRVPAEEKRELLGQIAELTGWSPKQIAEVLGMSERWVYKYLPEKYKRPEPEQLASARRALNLKSEETQERKAEQAITVPSSVPASGSVAPTLPSSQPKSLVEEPPLVRIIDKLKRYYPLSLIDWVYEFYQFSSAEQGAKLLKQVLEAVWSRIEKELGEEWIRNVVSEAIRQ